LAEMAVTGNTSSGQGGEEEEERSCADHAAGRPPLFAEVAMLFHRRRKETLDHAWVTGRTRGVRSSAASCGHARPCPPLCRTRLTVGRGALLWLTGHGGGGPMAEPWRSTVAGRSRCSDVLVLRRASWKAAATRPVKGSCR
ncbi:hypothetical protein Dimus_037687, partial [Dionaea muscipula]